MSVTEACPVLDGCRNQHPAHGQDECQVDTGNGDVDPQLAEQCPCVGACAECDGYGVVEWNGVENTCRSCGGTGSP